MTERRLASAGVPGNQVERILREAAAQDDVEIGHARGQAVQVYLAVIGHHSAPADESILSNGTSGHTSRTLRSPRFSPMKMTKSQMKCASTAVRASATSSGARPSTATGRPDKEHRVFVATVTFARKGKSRLASCTARPISV